MEQAREVDSRRHRRVALWTVYIAFFLDISNLACLIPLFKPTVARVEHDPATLASRLAWISSIAAMAETVSSPLTGALSDHFGRRLTMFMATFGSALAAVLVGSARSIEGVTLGRAINSISGSSISIAQAFVADVTTQEERPDYMIAITALSGVAFTVGPILGGWLNSKMGLTATFYLCSSVGFMNSLLVLFCLRTPPSAHAHAAHSAPSHAAGPAPGAESEAQAQQAAHSRRFPPMLWFLFSGVVFLSPLYAAFEICANIYVTDTFCGGDQVLGAQFFSQCYSCMGVALLVMSLCVYRRLQRAVGTTGNILIGGFLGAVGSFGQGMASTSAPFFVGTLIWSCGRQLVSPAFPLLITRLAHPSAYGKAFGCFKSFGNIARVVAPSIFMPIFLYKRSLIFAFLGGCSVMTALIAYIVAVAVGAKPPQGPAEHLNPALNGQKDSAIAPATPQSGSFGPSQFEFAREVSQSSDMAALDFGGLGSHMYVLNKPHVRVRVRSRSEEMPKRPDPGSSATELSRTFAGA